MRSRLPFCAQLKRILLLAALLLPMAGYAETHYEVLGISPTATADEAKKAYRQLAMRHHPDRNPNDPAAEERFKKVGAAWEIVGDPVKRAAYDRSQAKPSAQTNPGAQARPTGYAYRPQAQPQYQSQAEPSTYWLDKLMEKFMLSFAKSSALGHLPSGNELKDGVAFLQMHFPLGREAELVAFIRHRLDKQNARILVHTATYLCVHRGTPQMLRVLEEMRRSILELKANVMLDVARLRQQSTPEHFASMENLLFRKAALVEELEKVLEKAEVQAQAPQKSFFASFLEKCSEILRSH